MEELALLAAAALVVGLAVRKADAAPASGGAQAAPGGVTAGDAPTGATVPLGGAGPADLVEFIAGFANAWDAHEAEYASHVARNEAALDAYAAWVDAGGADAMIGAGRTNVAIILEYEAGAALPVFTSPIDHPENLRNYPRLWGPLEDRREVVTGWMDDVEFSLWAGDPAPVGLPVAPSFSAPAAGGFLL